VWGGRRRRDQLKGKKEEKDKRRQRIIRAIGFGKVDFGVGWRLGGGLGEIVGVFVQRARRFWGYWFKEKNPKRKRLEIMYLSRGWGGGRSEWLVRELTVAPESAWNLCRKPGTFQA